MSSTGGGARVSIPNSAKKTIQNIKEIAGNHTDEEVYAMLRECSMDPNETAQKLLLQDTFHVVKRKRDRRKENVSNKEATDSGWKSGPQGRGGRSGRGYSSRYISHGSGGGKSAVAGKESASNQGPDKGYKTTSILNAENKPAPSASNPVSGAANGPVKLVSQKVGSGGVSTEGNTSVENNKFQKSSSLETNIDSNNAASIGFTHWQSANKDHISAPLPVGSAPKVHTSTTDPILKPSSASCITGAGCGVEHQIVSQVLNQPTSNEGTSHGAPIADMKISLSENKGLGDSHPDGKVPIKSQGYEINCAEESQVRPTSSGTGTSGSRPTSNYSNRSQQLVSSQKVGPVKEWKPKSTGPNLVQTSKTVGSSEVAPTVGESAINPKIPEEATSKLQKKLEGLQFSDGQHVIFPSHLQVPEAERTVLSFGSFTVSLGPTTSSTVQEDEKSSTPHSESSEEEIVEMLSSSIQNIAAAPEEVYSVHPQPPHSPEHIPESLSSVESDVSRNAAAAQEYDQTKQQGSLAPEGPQYSVIQTAPAYSFGLVPPMFGSPFGAFENSESQARDTSRPSGFVVQQPFDPSANYYPQIYRPSADGDGRFSPFLAPGATTKYNPNLSSQNDQSQQETGNSAVQVPGQASIASQSSGVVQNAIAVTQQPVPVFRPPGGVHISHYPPNYIPYSHYYSPFYVPPSSLHPFLGNPSFPQQHPAGTIYPPVAAATTPVKYPVSQYNKSGGNSAHSGGGYGPYSSSQTGYSPSPVSNTVNSGSSEDNASQFKDNNVFLTGQQSEGSAVWIPTPTRDLPGLQASSFYNLSPQGQPVAFNPTQAGHGAFQGIYHPTQMAAAATVHPLLQQSQTVAGGVDMVGPQAGGYPPPQRAPINWGGSY